VRVRTRTWFSFVVLAALLFLAGSRFGVFDPLEDAVLAAAQPVESGLRAATEPLADLVNNVTDINRLSDENRDLRQENERLTADLARLRASETDLSELRQFLQIRGQRPGDAFMEANVFAREPSNLKDVVAIDQGKSDGLAEGMIVLSRQGSLVGSITRVLDSSAWVTLITDPSSAVSALIQESGAQGVVAGSAGGRLTMEFVAETADVKEGDLVLTSSIGGRYPPGELIGRVVEVERTAQELFQAVRVEPLADLARIDEVIVLTGFLPLDAGQP
jgi:rod shape-determining protein MreC